MNGDKIFIDTNICIYLLSGDKVLAELLQDQEIFISAVTEMELYAFHSSERATPVLNEFMTWVRIIEIDQHVKSLTIDVRKRTKLKLPDSIIAASALLLNLTFISADKSFKKVDDLDLIYYNPPINE